MIMSQLYSIAPLTNLIMKPEVYTRTSIFDAIFDKADSMSNFNGNGIILGINILDGMAMAYKTNAITPTDHMSVAVEIASQLTTSGAVNDTADKYKLCTGILVHLTCIF